MRMLRLRIRNVKDKLLFSSTFCIWFRCALFSIMSNLSLNQKIKIADGMVRLALRMADCYFAQAVEQSVAHVIDPCDGNIFFRSIKYHAGPSHAHTTYSSTSLLAECDREGEGCVWCPNSKLNTTFISMNSFI